MSKDYSKFFDQISEANQREEVLHKNSKVLIVDSLNTFLRSFVAIHHMNTQGNHIGGLTGFLKSIGSVIRHVEPTRVILVFDGVGGSTNKRYLYPEYKANRHITKISNWDAFDNQEEESEAITNQIVRLVEYLKYLPVDLVSIDKIEADDSIGYLTSKLPEKVVILSSDQDYLQLVSNRVSVFSPIKKKIYYPQEVKDEYGIPPQNFLTHKVLVGDKGDNIPGVRGIAIKTLLKMYPELKEEKLITLKEVLDKAQTKVGKKEAKYQDIYNYRHQLNINEKLMNLIEPNIPDQDKEFLDALVREYRDIFEPSAFIKLYNEDNLGGSISNVPVWLNETFSKLTKYK